MDSEVKELVEQLNVDDPNALDINKLATLYDVIKFGLWEYEDLLNVAQKHIDLLSKLPSRDIMNQLNRNFVEAFTNYKHDLSDVSFQPLIDSLKKTDDLAFVSMFIYFLSATGSKEYIPLVESYLNHPDQRIQDRAKETLKHLKY